METGNVVRPSIRWSSLLYPSASRSPGHRVPWWVLIWIKRSPLVFLVLSVACFSIGLCCFAYASHQVCMALKHLLIFIYKLVECQGFCYRHDNDCPHSVYFIWSRCRFRMVCLWKMDILASSWSEMVKWCPHWSKRSFLPTPGDYLGTKRVLGSWAPLQKHVACRWGTFHFNMSECGDGRWWFGSPSSWANNKPIPNVWSDRTSTIGRYSCYERTVHSNITFCPSNSLEFTCGSEIFIQFRCHPNYRSYDNGW